MVYLFDVPAYFILLRETLEVTIILAVLLGFIDKLVIDNDELKKKLKKQIWIGTGIGLGLTLVLGAIFIAVFYTIGKNFWEDSEAAWEGSFSLIASIVITLMALSMIRVQRWRIKWENKLKEATEQYLEKHERGNKWALIFLPFTVVCREGLESMVFIAGIGFDNPATGLPIPVIMGIITGFVVGYLIYKGSHKMSLSIFFNVTTVFLLFVSAGLFSRAVHELQEATETYEQVVWKLECCNPSKNGFWGIMKTLFGWTNKATVGTTVSYFVYWIAVGLVIGFMLYKDKKNKYTSDDLNEEVKDEKDKQATVNVMA